MKTARNVVDETLIEAREKKVDQDRSIQIVDGIKADQKNFINLNRKQNYRS